MSSGETPDGARKQLQEALSPLDASHWLLWEMDTWGRTGMRICTGSVAVCWLHLASAGSRERIGMELQFDRPQFLQTHMELYPQYMTFADDIGLIASSAGELSNMITRLADEGSKIGLIISVQKTKVMVIGGQLDIPIAINGVELEIVDHFKYLGSEISESATAAYEVDSRIRRARAAFIQLNYLWKNRRISINTKSRVYQASVRSVLLYSCETWPLNKEHERQLQVYENRCIRHILNISLLDRITTAEIMRRFKVNGCLSNLIKRRRLTWLGHVCRMHDDRIVKASLFHPVPQGSRRPSGGVRTTWIRRVFKDVDLPSVRRHSNMNYNNWKKNWLWYIAELANDRTEYKLFIDSVCAA